MCWTWCSAVRREMTRRLATSGLEQPCPTRRTTSTSRSLRPAGRRSAHGWRELAGAAAAVVARAVESLVVHPGDRGHRLERPRSRGCAPSGTGASAPAPTPRGSAATASPKPRLRWRPGRPRGGVPRPRGTPPSRRRAAGAGPPGSRGAPPRRSAVDERHLQIGEIAERGRDVPKLRRLALDDRLGLHVEDPLAGIATLASARRGRTGRRARRRRRHVRERRRGARRRVPDTCRSAASIEASSESIPSTWTFG